MKIKSEERVEVQLGSSIVNKIGFYNDTFQVNYSSFLLSILARELDRMSEIWSFQKVVLSAIVTNPQVKGTFTSLSILHVKVLRAPHIVTSHKHRHSPRAPGDQITGGHASTDPSR